MNKRIKDIADQCTDYRLDGAYYGAHFDKEQFATLIIKECIGLAKLANLSNTPLDTIKEHFGIEE